MKILQVNASARSHDAHSTRIADDIVARLRERHSDASVVVRDLSRQPIPVLDEAALTALYTPAGERTPEQAARVAIDDAAIAEIQAADIVVLGVPTYNFSAPVQFKAWIDAIARARVTFRYTENGPEGLLTGKTVYVALTRGSRLRDTPADHVVPWLRTVLGFLGMGDVRFVFAEGLGMGEAAVQQGLREAAQQIDAIVGEPAEAFA